MKKLTVVTVVVCAAMGLSGCSTQAERQAAQQGHYDAQREFATAAKEANQPIFELEAKDGEQITLGGVKKLTVRANQPAPVFAAAPVQRGDAVEVFALGLGAVERTLSGAVPFVAGAEVLKAALANRGVVDNSQHVSTSTSSTVGDNSGTNSGNSGALKAAGGALTDTTSSTTNTNSHNTDDHSATATPTVVTQPPPMTPPPPVVVCNPGPC